MRKISKKEFIQILSENESVLCGNAMNRPNDLEYLSGLIAKHSVSDYAIDRPKRKIKEVHSNHVIFTNDSYLYFDCNAKNNFYEIGDFLIYEGLQRKDRWHEDEPDKYTYLIYGVIR